MVLFMFVIMLVDLERRAGGSTDPLEAKPTRPMRWVWTLMAVLLVGLLLAIVLLDRPVGGSADAEAVRQALQGGFAGDGALVGNTERIGVLLYTSYLIPFELASVLLLVAMIGAVVLAHWKREEEGS
jgi:NADH-quinone oxidoreductase subunit J